MYDPPVGTTANVVATSSTAPLHMMISIRYFSGVNACEVYQDQDTSTTTTLVNSMTTRVSTCIVQAAFVDTTGSAYSFTLTNADEQGNAGSGFTSGTSVLFGSKQQRRPGTTTLLLGRYPGYSQHLPAPTEHSRPALAELRYPC